MKCKICRLRKIDSTLQPGYAMLPVWGVLQSTVQLESDIRDPRSTDYTGCTQNIIGSVFGSCLKCPKCGHSVTFSQAK